jgi:pantoate--beta-alanine ligase
MIADLNMPLEIVLCPTIREPSGLAVSSRNDYLTVRQRNDAAVIYRSLQKCRQLIQSGVSDIKTITTEMEKILTQVPSVEIQYVSVLDAETLEAIEKVRGKVLAAIAVKIGTARLIDNIMVDAPKQ